MNSDLLTPPPFGIPTAPDKPWSYKGRFGRMSFLAWYFIASLVSCAILIPAILIGGGFSLLESMSTGVPPSGGTLGLLLFFMLVFISISFYFSLICLIRRLHDLNKTGWFSLLIFVPFVNFIFIIYVCAAKGTAGPNRFGPVRETPVIEKVFGWAYIVITVMAGIGYTYFLVHFGNTLSQANQQTYQTSNSETYTGLESSGTDTSIESSNAQEVLIPKADEATQQVEAH